MKSTGIVRKVDELGRVVIPSELRKTMDIGEGEPLEIFVENDRIILRKYEPGCASCGAINETLKQVGKIQICEKCLAAAQ